MSKGDWWNYSWVVAPGCSKFGPECAHCWAEAMARRLQGMKKPGYEGLINERGMWSGKVSLLKDRIEIPVHLRKSRVIAVNLMGDLFHPQVPFEFIDKVFWMTGVAHWHTYMILTKRPERMVEFIRAREPRANVWLGTTAGTQHSANTRWSAMAWLAEAGWNTWVSSEPRLEAIDWHGWSFLKRLVTGGESGPYARPMPPASPRSDRDWCQAHGVEFWFKQWGEWGPPLRPSSLPATFAELQNAQLGELDQYPVTTIGNERLFRLGRKLAGRMLDGRIWGELKGVE